MAERLIALSEPELVRALEDLGRQVAYPTTPALAALGNASGSPSKTPSIGWRDWNPYGRASRCMRHRSKATPAFIRWSPKCCPRSAIIWRRRVS